MQYNLNPLKTRFKARFNRIWLLICHKSATYAYKSQSFAIGLYNMSIFSHGNFIIRLYAPLTLLFIWAYTVAMSHRCMTADCCV